MNKRTQHWTSELLTLLGIWLWKKEEYGHGLLCITGPQWGYKIGQQLTIVWDNIMHPDGDDFNWEFFIDDTSVTPRYVTEIAKEYLDILWSTKDIIEGDESIYLNSKTHKPLTTSTLNRELKRFSEEFLEEIEGATGMELNLKPLKSNAFQIAWALKMLKRYRYSKKCFIEISKFMGHKSLKHTTKILEIEPFDEIVFSFHGVYSEGEINTKVLDDKSKLIRIMATAKFDDYYQFKNNII